jgi:hypothetical protein
MEDADEQDDGDAQEHSRCYNSRCAKEMAYGLSWGAACILAGSTVSAGTITHLVHHVRVRNFGNPSKLLTYQKNHRKPGSIFNSQCKLVITSLTHLNDPFARRSIHENTMRNYTRLGVSAIKLLTSRNDWPR